MFQKFGASERGCERSLIVFKLTAINFLATVFSKQHPASIRKAKHKPPVVVWCDLSAMNAANLPNLRVPRMVSEFYFWDFSCVGDHAVKSVKFCRVIVREIIFQQFVVRTTTPMTFTNCR